MKQITNTALSAYKQGVKKETCYRIVIEGTKKPEDLPFNIMDLQEVISSWIDSVEFLKEQAEKAPKTIK